MAGAMGGRQGREAHRKALGWPFLDVEAGQVPVQLGASNCDCPSRRVECSATTTTPATASSSSCRWHLVQLLYGVVRVVWICDGVEFVETGVRNYLVTAQAAVRCVWWGTASEPPLSPPRHDYTIFLHTRSLLNSTWEYTTVFELWLSVKITILETHLRVKGVTCMKKAAGDASNYPTPSVISHVVT